MSHGFIVPMLFLLASLTAMPGTTVSGRLTERNTGIGLGGERAYVIAYTQAPGKADELAVLGYAHPDEQGNWSISGLPSEGKIHLAGFHRDRTDSMLHREITLGGNPVISLGILQTGVSPPASGDAAGEGLVAVPPALRNKRNFEIANELLKLVTAKEAAGARAVPATSEGSKSIDGLWTRSGRVYRIADGKAIVVEAGSTLATSVALGDEVMRNIKRTGDNTWTAEVLWQLASDKRWTTGTLTLSPDGNTLTRISISPWAGTQEAVLLSRK